MLLLITSMPLYINYMYLKYMYVCYVCMYMYMCI